MTHNHDLTTAGWTPRESLPPVITTAYVICATERSGSYLLCEALRRSHVASNPEEYFRPRTEPVFAERWSAWTFPDYYRACLRHCTDQNGVFGFKIHWEHLDGLLERLGRMFFMPDATPRQVLDVAFPHLQYVWIKRRDKVRQAISMHRANQTDVWISMGRKLPREQFATFNFNAIEDLVRRFQAHEDAWDALFRSNGIQPYTVIYEDFAPNPEPITQDILRFLGLPVTPVEQFGPRRMQKQADDMTEDWVRRYRAIKGQPAVDR